MAFLQRPSLSPCQRHSFRISDHSVTAPSKVKPSSCNRSLSMRLPGNKDRPVIPAPPHKPRRRSTADTFGKENRTLPPKLTPCNSTSSASTVCSNEYHPPEHVHAQQPSKKPLERRISGVFKLFHPLHHQRAKVKNNAHHNDHHNDHPIAERKSPHPPSSLPSKQSSLEKTYGPASNVIGLGTHAEVVTVHKAGAVFAVKVWECYIYYQK